MTRSKSRICCPKCGYNLRVIGYYLGFMKRRPYRCTVCKINWRVTMLRDESSHSTGYLFEVVEGEND